MFFPKDWGSNFRGAELAAIPSQGTHARRQLLPASPCNPESLGSRRGRQELVSEAEPRPQRQKLQVRTWGSKVSRWPGPRPVYPRALGIRLFPSLPPSEAHTRRADPTSGGGARPRPRPHYH